MTQSRPPAGKAKRNAPKQRNARLPRNPELWVALSRRTTIVVAKMEGALHATFTCDTDPTDVAFCDPSTGLVACGTMGGRIMLHSLRGAPEGSAQAVVGASPVRVFDLNGHDRASNSNDGSSTVANAVRAVEVVDSGRGICAGMHNASLCLVDIETGSVVRRVRPDLSGDVDPRDHGILRVLGLEEIFGNGHVIASGDESGTVALWDSRCSEGAGEGRAGMGSACLAELSPHDDYVSDMIVVPGKKSLLTTSGDGTLCLIDVRMKHGGGYAMKVKHRSEEDADDELLSVDVVRAGQKVVCGTTSGVLNIYSWGAWNDCSDRFPGHPDSITSVIAIDEETVLTGSSDGLIRVVGIHPNKFLGVLGEHSEFDIERLVMRKDKAYVASISHDPKVKIWNTSVLLGDGDDTDEDEREPADDAKGGDPGHDADEQRQAPESSEDSDDESDRRKRKKKNRGAHKIPKKTQQTAKDAATNFFADLM